MQRPSKNRTLLSIKISAFNERIVRQNDMSSGIEKEVLPMPIGQIREGTLSREARTTERMTSMSVTLKT